MTIGWAKTRFEKKVGLTLTVLTAFGLTASAATFAAFSDTTDNANNQFQAGSVDIDDNDAAAVLYDNFDGTPNAKPGDTESGCIVVTFNGSLDSTVRLYSPSTLNANNLDDQLTLDITSGTGVATPGSCAGFTANGATGDVFSGSLASFMSHADYATGVALDENVADANALWSNGDAVTYKFTVTLADDGDVNQANAGFIADTGTGYSTGLHTFTWEARNS
jgi:predicted ribosomally synthesized peptide with SipW-like signal peptide